MPVVDRRRAWAVIGEHAVLTRHKTSHETDAELLHLAVQPIQRGGKRCSDNGAKPPVMNRLTCTNEPPQIDEVIVEASQRMKQLPPAAEGMAQHHWRRQLVTVRLQQRLQQRQVLGPELPAAPQHRQSHGLGAARGEPVAAHARCAPDRRERRMREHRRHAVRR
eukprot:COSAG06_NODE_5364_length_3526_cov_1.923256_3_plen_164_part_00